MMKHKRSIPLLLILAFSLIVSGCAFNLLPEPNTPTPDVPASVTAAVSTAYAEMTNEAILAALSATATFTITPSPTLTPTDTMTPSLTPSLTPSFTLTETPTSTPKPGSNIPSNAIVAYFVSTGTGGPVGCGDTLVPVLTGHYRTGNTIEDLRAALNYLFAAGNYVLGLYNATYLSSFQATEITFDPGAGTATTLLAGSYTEPVTKCDAHRYRAQVWATALQFDEITNFTPYVGSKLLGDRLYTVMLNGADE